MFATGAQAAEKQVAKHGPIKKKGVPIGMDKQIEDIHRYVRGC